MVSNRKQVPNPPNSTKSRINRKRPEKVAVAKRHREKSNGGSSRKTIKKRTQPAPAGVLQAARPENRRIVLLDACNISHSSRTLPKFSTERLAKAIQFFVNLGHAVYAVFPRFHLYTRQWDNVDRLNGLYRKQYIVPTPCKEFPNPKSQVYDDRILMAIAAKFNCAVVSNDKFRDVASEHPDWARVANSQRISFSWDNDGTLLLTPYGFELLRE